jgi:hypothetical protein
LARSAATTTLQGCWANLACRDECISLTDDWVRTSVCHFGPAMIASLCLQGARICAGRWIHEFLGKRPARLPAFERASSRTRVESASRFRGCQLRRADSVVLTWPASWQSSLTAMEATAVAPGDGRVQPSMGHRSG